MPIYGLTPNLMEIGKIKIGMKGEEIVSKNNKSFRKAVKIDHFRIVTNERDEEDNLILDKNLLNIIKKGGEAKYNKNGDLVSIPIQLLYNDIHLTFPHELISMVNWKRSCSGDGKTATTRDGRTVECPCSRVEPGYGGKDKCLYSGVLSCVIDGANIGGCHKFRTKGFNSVNYILSSLTLIKTITGGLLAFLPLNLIVTSKKTVNPKTGEPITINVVTIETRDGGQEKLKKFALGMGQERTKLIENMGKIENEAKNFVLSETEDEEKEIFEEFYPNNVISETIEVLPEKEKVVANEKPSTEKEADAKKATSKTGKTSDTKEHQKGKDGSAKDDILGDAIAKDVGAAENGVGPSDSITKAQLRILMNLKSNVLKINDMKAWDVLIKKMKFKGVTKAKGMNVMQGNKFIEYLKSLKGNPT